MTRADQRRRAALPRLGRHAALCLCLLSGATLAGAQGVSNTAPSLPDLTQPGPKATPQHGAGEPVAPGTDTPTNAGAAGQSASTTVDGLTFLPYSDQPEGSTTLKEPVTGQHLLQQEALSQDVTPVVLDRVAVVINGDVILESDVAEEQHFAVFEPYTVPNGEFTPLEAVQHLVSRSLILQQMKEQQIVTPPTDAEVGAQLDELRKHIPQCAEYHCETDDGWKKFLAAQGFTQQSMAARWKQRMTILRFIELRFRSGIRISDNEIQQYYDKNIVPEFRKRDLKPPPLASTKKRIDEVLLQQRVTVLLNEWLQSLKETGNVAVLDPAYAAVGAKPQKAAAEASDGSGDENDQ